ncbi:MAG TPA: acyltransferase [Opitutaceae bacterium]|nr:acyltransferase [Opitutaceae bacterium]
MPQERFHGLDLLRTLAIVSVILWHVPREVYPLPFKPATWAGVDLFFVLSGFLIGSQLLRFYSQGIRPSYRDFALRRGFRIIPAYLAVLAAYVLIPQFREGPSMRPLWRFLTFTTNFGLDARAEGAFSQSWSLCVEEHFYLVLPLVVLWLMQRPSTARAWKTSAAIILGGLALRGFLWLHYIAPLRPTGWPITEYLENVYYPTYNRLDGLLCGVLLAAIRTFRPAVWVKFTRNGNLALGLGLVVTAGALWLCQDMISFWTATVGYPFLALGFSMLVVAAMSSSSLIGSHRVPGVTLGASLAYSTYLTHKEVMHLDRIYLSGWVSLQGWLGLAIYFLSFLVAAALLHLVVERPFLHLRDRILGKTLLGRPFRA